MTKLEKPYKIVGYEQYDGAQYLYPVEVVTEEEIKASSWIESSAEVASLATAEKRHFLNRF